MHTNESLMAKACQAIIVAVYFNLLIFYSIFTLLSVCVECVSLFLSHSSMEFSVHNFLFRAFPFLCISSEMTWIMWIVRVQVLLLPLSSLCDVHEIDNTNGNSFFSVCICLHWIFENKMKCVINLLKSV